MAKKMQSGMVLGSLAALLLSAAAHADRDPLIEGARQCTQYFPVEEKKNNIPTHLLAAIATTESGRYHDGLGMSVPWPWTINVEGKGYYFNSKAEAIAQTQNFLAKGHESIDVGCMQVNLKHHPKAFASLDQAFDPATNVSYAAKFLRDNYATLGDWIKATAAYHSRTPIYGNRYLVDIERSWNKIVGKVAAARAGGGAVSAANTQIADATPAAAPAPTKPRGYDSITEKKPRVVNTLHSSSRPMAEPVRARVISVQDSAPRATTTRENSVLVVRAQPSPPEAAAPVKVADAAPVATPAVTPVPNGDSVRRVSLDSNSSVGVVPKASSPQFVFAN